MVQHGYLVERARQLEYNSNWNKHKFLVSCDKIQIQIKMCLVLRWAWKIGENWHTRLQTSFCTCKICAYYTRERNYLYCWSRVSASCNRHTAGSKYRGRCWRASFSWLNPRWNYQLTFNFNGAYRHSVATNATHNEWIARENYWQANRLEWASLRCFPSKILRNSAVRSYAVKILSIRRWDDQRQRDMAHSRLKINTMLQRGKFAWYEDVHLRSLGLPRTNSWEIALYMCACTHIRR